MSTMAAKVVMRCLRRTYATFPTDRAAALALDASIPLKSKQLRDAHSKETSRQGEEASTLKRNELVQQRAQKVSEAISQRGRIRGIRRVKGEDGTVSERVVGHRIYLPNIIFRLVPNHTPKGQAYNPYEATFRIPQSINKTDVRSYLMAVYGVECTYIRTDNYLISLRQKKLLRGRPPPPQSNYKRAVVGLVKPFYFPKMLEDMDGKTRWLEQSRMEELTNSKFSKRLNTENRLRHTQQTAKKWTLRNEGWQTKKQVLGNMLRRKEEKEQRIRTAALALDKSLSKGAAASAAEP